MASSLRTLLAAAPGRGRRPAAERPRRVLITGASSGIGRACALTLDRLGWSVFAGVRNEADAESLRAVASGPLIPVRLDVTDSDQIEAAIRLVEEAAGSDGLDALVNNAGVVVAGPLELMPLDDFRHQLEVNVTGALAVTQAALGLLRQARGRVVMISSVSGRIAVPFIGPYAASKFALEALADALRLELAPQGVGVSVIEPGPINTPLMERSIRAAEERFGRRDTESWALYGPMLEAARVAALESNDDGLPPEAVARAVVHALGARRARIRYVVLRGSWLFRLAVNLLPDRLRDAAIVLVLKRARRKSPGG